MKRCSTQRRMGSSCHASRRRLELHDATTIAPPPFWGKMTKAAHIGRPSCFSALRESGDRELGSLFQRVIPTRQLGDDGELSLLACWVPILFDLHRLACAEHSRLHR